MSKIIIPQAKKKLTTELSQQHYMYQIFLNSNINDAHNNITLCPSIRQAGDINDN